MNYEPCEMPEELVKAHQIYISKNEHHTNYESITQYLEYCGDLDSIGPSMLKKCVASDTLWEVQWYPVTPISFYKVYGDTLKSCFQQIKDLERGETTTLVR